MFKLNVQLKPSFELLQILCWVVWFVPGSEVAGQLVTGNWTWLGGNNTVNQIGAYGTTSLNNRPGARNSHSMVIDPSGKLIFVFGGQGYDAATTVGTCTGSSIYCPDSIAH